MLDALLLWLGAIAIGFVLLNQGAKFLTDNATRIAGRIGRSRFVVGALFVSTLSAVPELLVSGIAAGEGSTDIALGNALASTVVTVAFVIGVSALVRAGLKWLVFGILWSVMGAQFLVQGAIGLSNAMGLNPWFIGITVVALGTSLPDIAAAWHATRLGYTDLVLGEGIGASVVTTLLTLGMIGILRPAAHSVELLLPVVGAMVFTAFLLLALMLGGWRITSRSGAVLASSYFAMVALNVLWIRGFP